MDPDPDSKSGFTKSLNLDPIRIRIHIPALMYCTHSSGKSVSPILWLFWRGWGSVLLYINDNLYWHIVIRTHISVPYPPLPRKSSSMMASGGSHVGKFPISTSAKQWQAWELLWKYINYKSEYCNGLTTLIRIHYF
jgi:hypothetical protein